jgi:hypothetical protein
MRFLEGLENKYVNSEKLAVFFQSAAKGKINAIKNTNLPSPKKVTYLKNLSKKLLWKVLTIIEKLRF